jgi:hypothetical protein
MKIYVAGMEALKKKERHPEIQFISKIDDFLIFTPFKCICILFKFFLKKTLFMTKLRALMLCFLVLQIFPLFYL